MVSSYHIGKQRNKLVKNDRSRIRVFFFLKLCKPRKRNTGEKMITDLADLIKLNTKPVVWKTRKRRPIPSNSVFLNIR